MNRFEKRYSGASDAYPGYDPVRFGYVSEVPSLALQTQTSAAAPNSAFRLVRGLLRAPKLKTRTPPWH